MIAAHAREIEKLLQRISKLEAEIEYKNEMITLLVDRHVSYKERIDALDLATP